MSLISETSTAKPSKDSSIFLTGSASSVPLTLGPRKQSLGRLELSSGLQGPSPKGVGVQEGEQLQLQGAILRPLRQAYGLLSPNMPFLAPLASPVP